MSRFKFLIRVVTNTLPQEWLRVWADLYQGYDETVYKDLIGKYESLSAEDFIRIGKWKDGAKTERQWKPNVASVAYEVWMKAAQELPKCPEGSSVADFLDDWSGRTYTDVFEKKGPVEKHFGLARATTLLHFISGGRFPIFDSRVRTAIARLLDGHLPPNTVRWYLDSFRPLFSELATLCDSTGDLRRLDKALFSYGSSEKLRFSN
ncbi:MAG TPA: hypothetical protein VKS00_04575 [Candidatus Acidoferrales bacterium]|nr:hypothetical protein [Candidatus Acidoferrales bacterium]